MKRINLLPPEQRTKASRERGLLWAILILVALVVVLGAVYIQQKSQVSSKEDELAAIQAEQAQLDAQIAALQPYADLQSTRVQMTQTAKGIYDARVYWSTILEQVSLVIPENVRLTSMTCTVPPEMLPGGTASTTGAAPVANVTFVGTTYTHEDVAEFMTRLGLIPQLKNIQLSASTGAAPTSTTGSSASPAPVTVTFTVTASLRPYLTAPPTTTLQEGVSQ